MDKHESLKKEFCEKFVLDRTGENGLILPEKIWASSPQKVWSFFEKALKDQEEKIKDSERWDGSGTTEFTTITPPEILHTEYKRGFDEGYENGRLHDEECAAERSEFKAKIKSRDGLLNEARKIINGALDYSTLSGRYFCGDKKVEEEVIRFMEKLK